MRWVRNGKGKTGARRGARNISKRGDINGNKVSNELRRRREGVRRKTREESAGRN